MKRILKGLLIAAMTLLWLAAAGLGLEVYGRRMDRQIESQYQAINTALEHAAETDTARMRIRSEYGEAVTESPKRHLPPRESFGALDEAGRAALARQRQELVLACGPGGTVQSVYPVDTPPEIGELAARIRPGATLSSLLPEEASHDAQSALERAFGTGATWAPDYPIPLANGKDYVFQFHFVPVQDAQRLWSRVFVFIQPSIWDVLWFSFKKNFDSSDGFYFAKVEQFRTNSAGFRDDDVTLPKPPGVYRIVCVGASTTAEGPTNALTYPNMLEKKLRKHFGSEAIEVVNCGIYGIQSYKERQRLPDYLALQPDMILFYDLINDVRTDSSLWIQPDAGKPQYRLKQFKMALRRSRFIFNVFNRFLLPSDEEIAAGLESDTLTLIRDIAAAAKRAGADFATGSFAFPDLTQCSRDEAAYFERAARGFGFSDLTMGGYAHIARIFNARLKTLCQDEGMIYAPVAEGIQEGTACFTDCCHMNLVGMERKADIFFNAIKDAVAARRSMR